MITVNKNVLRESIEICRHSNLYDSLTREEKRETVMHVYRLINEYQAPDGNAVEHAWELQPLSMQT